MDALRLWPRSTDAVQIIDPLPALRRTSWCSRLIGAVPTLQSANDQIKLDFKSRKPHGGDRPQH